MKRMLGFGVVLLLVAFSRALSDDFPVAHSVDKEWLPAVAYNSTDHEYLVVWSEEVFSGVIWVNWVFGQRVGEDGGLLGSAFAIFTYGVNPVVAYNGSTNEYLVAFNPGGGFVGQRVSSAGALLGSPTTIMNDVSDGRLVYNSITGQYLFVGALLVETPAGSGYYNVRISSCKVGANGDAVGSPLVVDERPHGYNPPEPAFAVAYAPIASTETPGGRYLLAFGRGVVLEMLDSDGAPIDIVHDPDHPGVHYKEIPFKTGTPSAGEFNVDVAYGDESGHGMTGPAFLVVWADQNNRYSSQSWTGIWGGFLDATKFSYSTKDTVQDRAFPISAIADHYAYDPQVESWRPKASYNPVSQKFFVAWRETPGTSQYNDTKVNHIRGSYVYERVPANNVIISATGGTEDPTRPAVAASTASEHALVLWQDSRNLGSLKLDVYGSILKVADPVPPLPPTSTRVVVNTLDSGPGSLRQAILDANARSGKDTISFNIPGSGPHTIMPLSPLPALTDPVVIDGYTQPGSRANMSALKDPDNAILKIVLDGTVQRDAYARAFGLEVRGGDSRIRGLVMHSFSHLRGSGGAIVVHSNGGNIIEGNYIETDDDGLTGYVSGTGILIVNATGNLIGGTEPAARNIIFGSNVGVHVMQGGTSGNTVAGNYIGVNATGDGALGTSEVGIMLKDAPSNTIGGTTAGAGNVISGFGDNSGPNRLEGCCVRITGDTAKGNVVAGNLIGTNAAGTDTITNYEVGILIESGENLVGETEPAARNIISGNGISGVKLAGRNNTVQGNYIGADITGTKAIPNGVGVVIIGGRSNTVGGAQSGAGNVISGNRGSAVLIGDPGTSYNLLEGNRIGTQADGISPLGNEFCGVVVYNDADHNTIGGAVEGAGNVIAFNGSVGVNIRDNSLANRISCNSIHGNGWLGIDLTGGVEDGRGVTNNDLGDGDTGPNSLQNFPIVGTVVGGSSIYLEGILNSTADATFRIEFFASPAATPPLYGEGQKYLGWMEVTTDATGNAPFTATIGTPVAAGQSITATATDTAGNTSEFGIPTTVTLVGGWELVTNTLDSGPGSLRQAILNANAKGTSDTIAFDIPGTKVHKIRPATPLPAISATVVIDGYTQPGSRENTGQLSEGDNAVLKIEIDGSYAGVLTPGLRIMGGNSVVRGLIINRFDTTPAIRVSETSGCRIEGCFIGTDSSGLVRMGNFVGVSVSGVSNTVGGLAAAERNIISGNLWDGVSIGNPGWGNYVLGNYIGLDATGKVSLGNDGSGVVIKGSWSNRIGGSVAGSANAIAGGTSKTSEIYCIHITGQGARKNVLEGNFIGTNASGTDTVANRVGRAGGILILSNNNTVGGTSAASRNVISGNYFGGVMIGSDSNTVQGNYIGSDVTGTKSLGNNSTGILIAGNWNLVGGRTTAAGNLISGNVIEGVSLRAGNADVFRGNRVQGNRIGTQADGASPLGNGGPGVEIGMNCMEAVIGDTLEGAGNIIAFNGGDGLRVVNYSPDIGKDPMRNRMSGNSIFANVGLGINIIGGVEDGFGVTANDPGDADTGPNELQNSPALTSAEWGGSPSVRGSLNSTPGSRFTLEFYATPVVGAPGHGEGQTFLGWAAVQSDAAGDAPFTVDLPVPVAAGRAITATATDYLGNTSEFSPPVIVNVIDAVLGGEIPAEFALLQNYPNPFNASTTIRYSLPVCAHVILNVFNTLGQQVGTLVEGEQEAGYHEVRFDGSNLASGVYMCRLQAGDFTQTRRLSLLR